MNKSTKKGVLIIAGIIVLCLIIFFVMGFLRKGSGAQGGENSPFAPPQPIPTQSNNS